MDAFEERIARHYTHGALTAAIERGLQASGPGGGELGDADLAGMDEFHMGGREATAALAESLDLKPEMSLLDIGCGIGGAARFFAQRFGCRVTGVDLTPEYIETARALSMRLGVADRVEFHVGSALALPFADESFDAASLLPVGMNIPDKRRLAAETARVLKPGGTIAVYDIMRTGSGAIDFPMPWAASEDTSFLVTPADYRAALAGAGFDIAGERDRRDLALQMFARMRAKMAEGGGPPPLGLHILMGKDAPAKIANMVAMLERERIAPVEIIAHRA